MVPFCLLLFVLVLVQGRPQQVNNNQTGDVIDISYKPTRPSYHPGSVSNVAQIIPPGQPWPSNPAGYANFSQTSPPPPQEASTRWNSASSPSTPSDGQIFVPVRNDEQPLAPAPPPSDGQSPQNNNQSVQNNDQSLQSNGQSPQQSNGQAAASDPQSPPTSNSNNQSPSSSQPPSNDQSSSTPAVYANELSTSRPQLQVDDEPVKAVTEAAAAGQASSGSSDVTSAEVSTQVPTTTTTQKQQPAPSLQPLPVSDDIPQAPFLSVNVDNILKNEARSKPPQEPNTFLIPEPEPEPELSSTHLPHPSTPVAAPEVTKPEPEVNPVVPEINQSQLPYEPPNPEVFKKVAPGEENPTINAVLPLHPKKPEINQNQPTPPHVPAPLPEIPPTTPRAGRRTNNLGRPVGNELPDTRFVNRPQGRPFDFAPNGFPEEQENTLPAGGNVYRYPLPPVPPPGQYYPRRHDYPGPFRGHVRFTIRPHLVYPF